MQPTRFTIIRAAAGALALFTMACGGAKEGGSGATTKTAQGSTAGKTFRIAMIAKSSTNPVFLSARTGADAAAAEAPKKYGVNVKVDWLTPPEEDGQVQAQRIAQAVNDGDNAILLSASDAGKVTGAVNAAVDRDVPVMTFDSDVPNSKRFAFYGGDDHAIGVQVMSELAKQMGGKGNIGIMAGNQNATNLQQRVKGVVDEAKKYPGIKILTTVYFNETPQDAASELLRVQNAYPSLNGWASIGGWPLWTRTLLTDLDPKKVKIVSVDGLPVQLPYVEKGIAPVLLAQPTYDWGYVSVNTILDTLVAHKHVPQHVQMDLVRVDKDNLGTWARQLKAWGFTDVDPKYLALPK